MKRFLPAVLILVAVAVVYGRTATFSFVAFDDFSLILDNPRLCCGITGERLHWIWFEAWKESVYWIRPLTLMSHLFDGALFGRHPLGPHLLNTGLHAGCALLLLFWLSTLTGSPGRSLLVALLFAVHPLTADVVAWVAQRSSLLSTLFFLAALTAYQSYRRTPSFVRWLPVFLLFLGAVGAKPSAVVFPVILVLVDVWGKSESDLKIGEGRSARTIWQGKVLFFVLAAGVTVLLVSVARSSEAAVTVSAVSFPLRLANALVAAGGYIITTVVPAGLCVYYPFPTSISWWRIGGSLLLLAVVTTLVILRRRQAPLALCGWLWYLVALAPVAGLVQAGPWPGRADHYMYLPLIGLLMTMIWAVPEKIVARVDRRGIGVTAAILVLFYGALAFRQAGFYRDSRALFSRALAVTENNFLAHTGLGNVRLRQGRLPEAEDEFRRALVLRPEAAGAHANLGLVLAQSGRFAEAGEHYRQALHLDPKLVEAHVNLANLLVRQGKEDTAVVHYLSALAIDPDAAEANYNLGRLLAEQGDPVRAGVYLRRACALHPEEERYQRARKRLPEVAKDNLRSGLTP